MQPATMKTALKLLSVLLRYPEKEWITALPSLRRASEKIDEPDLRTVFDRFLSWAASSPPLCLQEHYTGAFDLSPSTSLDVTYHSRGDSEDRGKDLAFLRQVYRCAGYETTTDELPDHLPLVLEFLSTGAEGSQQVTSLCAPPVRDLAGKLQAAKSPYADLVGSACDLLSAMAGEAQKERIS